MDIMTHDLLKLLDITLYKLIKIEMKLDMITIKKIQILSVYIKLLTILKIKHNSPIIKRKIFKIKEKINENNNISLEYPNKKSRIK